MKGQASAFFDELLSFFNNIFFKILLDKINLNYD
jgi:hypothetical protein